MFGKDWDGHDVRKTEPQTQVATTSLARYSVTLFIVRQTGAAATARKGFASRSLGGKYQKEQSRNSAQGSRCRSFGKG